MDRRAPRGGGRVRRLRAGAADRHARRLHGHRRARARSTCSTGSTTPRSRTRRCSRCAARCRWPSSARDFFQEVDNDALFADVAVFRAHDHEPRADAGLLERAVQAALQRARRRGAHAARRRRRRWTSPKGTPRGALRRRRPPRSCPTPARCDDAAARDRRGRRRSRCSSASARARRATSVLALADRLAAPMVLTLKAKEGLEHDNPFQVGQTGLIGNPAARNALDGADLLLMLGTDFPYRDWYPEGKVVVQVDERGEHIGRRTRGRRRRRRRRRARRARRCSSCVAAKPDRAHLDDATRALRRLARRASASSTDPDYDGSGLVDTRAREARQPRATASAPRRSPPRSTAHAAADAIFTSDTGMSTVWLSRFVTMTRHAPADRLLQPRLDGQRDAAGARRAGARPRRARSIAFCGDGGLTMLLGDLITAVSHDLPVKLVVFDNGRLGHGQARAGAGRPARVRHRAGEPRPRRRGARDRACTACASRTPEELDGAVRDALAHAGPGAARRASPTPTRSRCRRKVKPARRRGASRSPSSARTLESRGA